VINTSLSACLASESLDDQTRKRSLPDTGNLRFFVGYTAHNLSYLLSVRALYFYEGTATMEDIQKMFDKQMGAKLEEQRIQLETQFQSKLDGYNAGLGVGLSQQTPLDQSQSLSRNSNNDLEVTFNPKNENQVSKFSNLQSYDPSISSAANIQNFCQHAQAEYINDLMTFSSHIQSQRRFGAVTLKYKSLD
jgi:hypothetical protein